MDRNILIGSIGSAVALVALRKESVDRNMGVGTTRDRRGVSLSARRAWIEIALLNTQQRHLASRSPQGERG